MRAALIEFSEGQKSLTRKIIETFPLFMRKLFHGFPFYESEFELNKTQQKTLHIIHYHKNTHMGEIAGHLNMEKGSFTPVVDALIEKGLIRRKRDKQDRRKVQLIITQKGLDFVVRFEEKMNNHIRDKITNLTEDDRKRFYRAIEDLNEIVEKM